MFAYGRLKIFVCVGVCVQSKAAKKHFSVFVHGCVCTHAARTCVHWYVCGFCDLSRVRINCALDQC